MTLASLLSGVLNTLGRFALTAAAPILPQCLHADPAGPAPTSAASGGVGGGGGDDFGFLQSGLLWLGARKLGVDLRTSLPVLSRGVRRMLAIAVPGAIAARRASGVVTGDAGAVGFG